MWVPALASFNLFFPSSENKLLGCWKAKRLELHFVIRAAIPNHFSASSDPLVQTDMDLIPLVLPFFFNERPEEALSDGRIINITPDSGLQPTATFFQEVNENHQRTGGSPTTHPWRWTQEINEKLTFLFFIFYFKDIV